MAVAREWIKRLGVLGLLLVLSSCYIPDKFRSELRLSRYGDYSISFQGDLLYVPILHEYAEGRLNDPVEAAAHEENIRRDLVRDIAFQKIEPKGRGRYSVKYERQGRLGQVQLVALIRRDARMLALRSVENGAILIAANSIKPSDAQAMAELGLGMEGEFRVTTDANVVQNNATTVRDFGKYRVYVWQIENALSPMPHLVILRDPDPQRPLAPRVSERK
jgi:hypothetical protein